MVPTRSRHPIFLCLWCRKLSGGYWKRKVNTKTATKPLTYDLICSVCKTCEGNGGTELVGIVNQCLIWLKAESLRWNPYLVLLRWPRTRDKIALRPKASALFSHYQRSFLLQQTETGAETQSKTLWRGRRRWKESRRVEKGEGETVIGTQSSI